MRNWEDGIKKLTGFGK